MNKYNVKQRLLSVTVWKQIESESETTTYPRQGQCLYSFEFFQEVTTGGMFGFAQHFQEKHLPIAQFG